MVGIIIAHFFSVLLCLARTSFFFFSWGFLTRSLDDLACFHSSGGFVGKFVCIASVPHTNRHVNGWFITFECLVYLRSEHHGQTECRSAVRMLALRLTAERGGEKGTTTMGGSGLVYGLRLDVVV